MNLIPLSPNTPLNPEQISIINKPYNEGALGRAFAYTKEHPKEVLSTVSLSNDIFVDLAAMCVAGELSAIAGLCVTAALKCGPESVGKGMSWGALLGLGAYEGAVLVYNVVEIKKSPAYKAWKIARIKMIEIQAVNNFIKNDDILRHLRCPITGEIPKIPARFKHFNNQTYEFSKAVSWINDHPGEPLPGLPEAVTDIEDLKFDFPQINAVVQRAENLENLVNEERYNKVYLILGVKTTNLQNVKEVNKLFFMIEMCELNKIHTLGELFAEVKTPLGRSLLHIETIRSRIQFTCAQQKRERFSEFASKFEYIKNLPHHTTPERQFKYLEAIDFGRRISCIRRVMCEDRSSFLGKIRDLLKIPKTYTLTTDAYNDFSDEMIQRGLFKGFSIDDR